MADVEHLVRLWSGEPGVFLEVGQWDTVPGYVEIRTANKASEDHYGRVSVVLNADQAIAMAEAIRHVAGTLS